jgi:hypothetical protein
MRIKGRMHRSWPFPHPLLPFFSTACGRFFLSLPPSLLPSTPSAPSPQAQCAPRTSPAEYPQSFFRHDAARSLFLFPSHSPPFCSRSSRGSSGQAIAWHSDPTIETVTPAVWCPPLRRESQPDFFLGRNHDVDRTSSSSCNSTSIAVTAVMHG